MIRDRLRRGYDNDCAVIAVNEPAVNIGVRRALRARSGEHPPYASFDEARRGILSKGPLADSLWSTNISTPP